MHWEFETLWKTVAQHYHGDQHSIHGPSHWRRVLDFGLLIGKTSGADLNVVRLFALFHDCCRLNDGFDPEHGARGAAYAQQLRGIEFELDDEAFKKLHYACSWHTDKLHHRDPTIGTC